MCSPLDALEHSSEDVDKSWTVFRDTVLSSAMDSLGLVFRNKENQGLLEEKHHKHKAYLSDTRSVSSKTAYSNICKTVQTRLRDMQYSWLSKKADEIQSFADRKIMKKFFDAQDCIWSPELRNHPLLSADGTSLQADKEAILQKWAEGIDGVLNRPSSISEEAINRLSQMECNQLLEKFPTVSKTVKAIKLLLSIKALGSDLCRPYQSIWQSVVKDFGKLWQSLAIRPSS